MPLGRVFMILQLVQDQSTHSSSPQALYEFELVENTFQGQPQAQTRGDILQLETGQKP